MAELQDELSQLRELVDALRRTPDKERVEDVWRRVRDLVRISRETPEAEDAEALYQEVLRLRRGGEPPPLLETPAGLKGQLARARTRIETGDVQDVSLAIDVLGAILRQNPDYADALNLLETAVQKYPDMSEKVKQVLEDLVRGGRLQAQPRCWTG